MFIQIGYQESLNLSLFNSFEELIDGLNNLLGENTFTIEKNGRKIDLSGEHELEADETYKIWPKVLGGKVSREKYIFFLELIFFVLGWFWVITTFIW